jgi:DNA-binding response OmpR family regulator
MSQILIVEGDAAQQMLLDVEISEMRYVPILAKNGVEAITKFHRYHPDLVILDLQLPNQDGLIALHSLLSADPAIPLIIYTAYTHYQHWDLSWAAKAYIVKSADFRELKNTVQKILNGRISK